MPVSKSSVEPETMYILKVTRAVTYGASGRAIMTPTSENVVKGKVILEIPDEAIESIENIF
jgi:hypothetical protein